MRMFYRAGLILCLGAVLVSAETGCPYPEDVEPCKCELVQSKYASLTCEKVYDTEILLRVFKNSIRYTFDSFNLRESSLQYIPHQIFDDVVVNKFQMFNVTLRTMFDEVPRDPGNWQIKAEGSTILGGLDWKTLAVFKRLQSIEIFDMPLKKLPATSFSKVSKKLQGLACWNCKIKLLEEYLFKDFFLLEQILLAYNAIPEIKRTMFPDNSSHLDTINLKYNKISTLPSDIFSGMSRLMMVFLRGNRISVLPEAAFPNVILQHNYLIDVIANPIKCDCLIAWVLEAKKVKWGIEGYCYEPKALRNKHFNQLTRRDIRCELSSNSIL